MSQNETSYPDYDDLIEDVISAAQDVLSSIEWGENGRNAATRLEASKEALVTYIVGVETALAKAKARIVELSQAVGLITTLKPTMVMDTEHPFDMAKEVAEYVNARIAELEAAQRWIPIDEKSAEMHTTVLVACKDGYMTSVVASPFCQFKSGFPFSDVTHWMPLPKVPQYMDRKETDKEPDKF